MFQLITNGPTPGPTRRPTVLKTIHPTAIRTVAPTTKNPSIQPTTVIFTFITREPSPSPTTTTTTILTFGPTTTQVNMLSSGSVTSNENSSKFNTIMIVASVLAFIILFSVFYFCFCYKKNGKKPTAHEIWNSHYYPNENADIYHFYNKNTNHKAISIV